PDRGILCHEGQEGRSIPSLASRPYDVLALLEGGVGDALQELGVGRQRADVAPVDLVGRIAEMLFGERGEPRQHGVDFGLPSDEGVERLGVVALAAHGRTPSFVPPNDAPRRSYSNSVLRSADQREKQFTGPRTPANTRRTSPLPVSHPCRTEESGMPVSVWNLSGSCCVRFQHGPKKQN